MEAAIEAIGLSRSFSGVPAVRHATLSVYPGEVTALVGPNGSGKTTLMLMLATLLKPDSGTVRVGGHDVATSAAAARACLGWMPDTLGAWPTLTVRETLHTVCSMYGLRNDAARARATELLDLTGLTALAAQRSNTLSRGQKQRLSLARALAHDPRVLLLDEPASGLDPEARLMQRHMLTELASRGVAILVTSHVLDELEEIASNVVFLREGHTAAPEAVHAALRQGREWRIRALDDGRLVSALAHFGYPSTTRASLGGTVHTVQTIDDPAAAGLLAALVAEGVEVIEFGPASSALEHAFVQLAADGAPNAAPTHEPETNA